ncbi:hypothetical protein HDK64DRAFT_112676 [Phyllosticta capitalensis]
MHRSTNSKQTHQRRRPPRLCCHCLVGGHRIASHRDRLAGWLLPSAGPNREGGCRTARVTLFLQLLTRPNHLISQSSFTSQIILSRALPCLASLVASSSSFFLPRFKPLFTSPLRNAQPSHHLLTFIRRHKMFYSLAVNTCTCTGASWGSTCANSIAFAGVHSFDLLGHFYFGPFSFFVHPFFLRPTKESSAQASKRARVSGFLPLIFRSYLLFCFSFIPYSLGQ